MRLHDTDRIFALITRLSVYSDNWKIAPSRDPRVGSLRLGTDAPPALLSRGYFGARGLHGGEHARDHPATGASRGGGLLSMVDVIA